MKKIIIALMSTLLVAMLLSACGGKDNTKVNNDITLPEVDPVALLPANDVYTALDFAYVPVVDDGVVVRDGNKATAVYVSENNTLSQEKPEDITNKETIENDISKTKVLG